MIRVLHIIVGLNLGGAELMLKRLIESSLDNSDFQHSVVSLTDAGEVGEQLLALGVEVQALGMRSVLDAPRVLWQLTRRIRKSRADIVQTWMYHANLWGGLAARIAGNQHVIWGIRTTDVKAGASRTTAVISWMCAMLSRWIPRAIVCAAEASRMTHVAVGYDPTRMVVIPNGFDLQRLMATADQRIKLRAQCGFAADEVVIGIVGRFNRAKDHENFVCAAGLLTRQDNRVRFLMVGRDLDAGNTELARWITQTGYAERFVLLGERADVPACLSAMDIFCLSSRTEGFPNGVGEAMAMGLPCVVTDAGDAAMLVADTGIVVPREAPIALSRGLGGVLAMTPDARQQLGLRAKARMYSEFSIERARQRFEDVYSAVLKLSFRTQN
ncbi:MAG: glycosyltransferase family 4 protein [Stenotrophobium sp.]